MSEPARLPVETTAIIPESREKIILLQRIRRLSLCVDLSTDRLHAEQLAELRAAHAEYNLRFERNAQGWK